MALMEPLCEAEWGSADSWMRQWQGMRGHTNAHLLAEAGWTTQQKFSQIRDESRSSSQAGLKCKGQATNLAEVP